MTLSLETKGNKLPQAFTTSTSLTSLTKATYDTNTGSDHSSNLKLSVLFKATVLMDEATLWDFEPAVFQLPAQIICNKSRTTSPQIIIVYDCIINILTCTIVTT